MKKTNKLIKNTVIFAIGNFGAKILTFILVPIYTYYLCTNEMGKYDMILTMMSLISPIISLGLYDAVYRWLLDRKYIENTLRTAFRIMGKLSMMVLLASILICILTHSLYIVIYILLFLSNSYYVFLQYITRGLCNNRLYALQGILYAVVNFGLSMLLVAGLKWGYMGLVIAMALSDLIMIIFMMMTQKVFCLIKQGSYDIKIGREMIRYSAALVPNNISWWMVSSFNKFIILMFLGISANGIWAISYKFPSILQIFTSLFYLAWQEQAIEEYDTDARDEYYSMIFDNYMTFVLSGVLILIPLSKVMIYSIFDPSYYASSKYVGFLLIGTAFSAFSSFYGTAYLSSKETRYALSSTILGASLNCILNAIFVPFYGLQAAAIATAVSYLVMWVDRIYNTKKFFDIKIEVKKCLSLIVLCIIFAIANNYVTNFFAVVLTSISCIIALFFNRRILYEAIKLTYKYVNKKYKR